jgi:3-dehydroquinate synthetase
MAVKIHFIEADPFEKGIRAALNYGHTVGHGVELASGFHLRHGEAVAIGMVVEARIAEKLSIATNGLSRQIACALAGIGLPIKIPSDLSKEAILQAMKVDKKKQAGKVLFSLPLKIGEVKTSIEIDDLNMVFMED